MNPSTSSTVKDTYELHTPSTNIELTQAAEMIVVWRCSMILDQWGQTLDP